MTNRKEQGKIGWFWIDSICVPLDPAVRIRAIKQMGDTFKKASDVLILDHDLQRFDSRLGTPEELMLRIAARSWNQRLWTFQEVSERAFALIRPPNNSGRPARPIVA